MSDPREETLLEFAMRELRYAFVRGAIFGSLMTSGFFLLLQALR